MSDKEYALFAGNAYYPKGGVKDFKAFGTIRNLKEMYRKNYLKWASEAGGTHSAWGHIANIEMMECVVEDVGIDEEIKWVEVGNA